MHILKMIGLGLFATFIVSVQAVAFENFKTVGQASYTFMFMDIYDAELLAPHGNFNFNAPFALKLTYHKNLKGSSIAKRSRSEIESLGFTDEHVLNEWHEFMKETFPNVHSGDVITGYFNKQKQTVFYYNGSEIGRIDNPDFGHWFFGIWLHKNTSVPQFRKSLLNIS